MSLLDEALRAAEAKFAKEHTERVMQLVLEQLLGAIEKPMLRSYSHSCDWGLATAEFEFCTSRGEFRLIIKERF